MTNILRLFYSKTQYCASTVSRKLEIILREKISGIRFQFKKRISEKSLSGDKSIDKVSGILIAKNYKLILLLVLDCTSRNVEERLRPKIFLKFIHG